MAKRKKKPSPRYVGQFCWYFGDTRRRQNWATLIRGEDTGIGMMDIAQSNVLGDVVGHLVECFGPNVRNIPHDELIKAIKRHNKRAELPGPDDYIAASWIASPYSSKRHVRMIRILDNGRPLAPELCRQVRMRVKLKAEGELPE